MKQQFMAPHEVSKDVLHTDERGIFYDGTLLDNTFWAEIFSRIKKVLHLIGKLEPAARQLGWITIFEVLTFPFSSILVTRTTFYLGQSIFILIL